MLCVHEMYLQKDIYTYRQLSEGDRFLLSFAFSGSELTRNPPLPMMSISLLATFRPFLTVCL